MSVLYGRTGHVFERFLALEPDLENLARAHGFDFKLGSDKSHWAHVARYINKLIGVMVRGFVHGFWCLLP